MPLSFVIVGQFIASFEGTFYIKKYAQGRHEYIKRNKTHEIDIPFCVALVRAFKELIVTDILEKGVVCTKLWKNEFQVLQIDWDLARYHGIWRVKIPESLNQGKEMGRGNGYNWAVGKETPISWGVVSWDTWHFVKFYFEVGKLGCTWVGIGCQEVNHIIDQIVYLFISNSNGVLCSLRYQQNLEMGNYQLLFMMCRTNVIDNSLRPCDAYMRQ